jgi:uncharacterized OB-fold protein
MACPTTIIIIGVPGGQAVNFVAHLEDDGTLRIGSDVKVAWMARSALMGVH